MGLNRADTWLSSLYRYFCMAIPKNACIKTKRVLQQLEDPYEVAINPITNQVFVTLRRPNHIHKFADGY